MPAARPGGASVMPWSIPSEAASPTGSTWTPPYHDFRSRPGQSAAIHAHGVRHGPGFRARRGDAGVRIALVARFVRGRRPPVASELTQEVSDAAESAPRPARFNFDPRFCLVAFVFVVFDVAIAFLVPVAVVLKRWVAAGRGTGVRALIEVFAFAGVLLLGLAYARKNGDLGIDATAGGAPRRARCHPTTILPESGPRRVVQTIDRESMRLALHVFALVLVLLASSCARDAGRAAAHRGRSTSPRARSRRAIASRSSAPRFRRESTRKSRSAARSTAPARSPRAPRSPRKGTPRAPPQSRSTSPRGSRSSSAGSAKARRTRRSRASSKSPFLPPPPARPPCAPPPRGHPRRPPPDPAPRAPRRATNGRGSARSRSWESSRAKTRRASGGISIEAVDPSSRADKAGIQAGDLLTSLDKLVSRRSPTSIPSGAQLDRDVHAPARYVAGRDARATFTSTGSTIAARRSLRRGAPPSRSPLPSSLLHGAHGRPPHVGRAPRRGAHALARQSERGPAGSDRSVRAPTASRCSSRRTSSPPLATRAALPSRAVPRLHRRLGELRRDAVRPVPHRGRSRRRHPLRARRHLARHTSGSSPAGGRRTTSTRCSAGSARRGRSYTTRCRAQSPSPAS